MDEVFIAQGRLSDLAAVIDFVESWCARSGVDSAVWTDLQLAVEEACTNIIEHAYQGRGGEFRVRCETQGSDVVITLRDRGRTFNPQSVTPPDFSLPLEERPLGGLGLHLMQQLMDEVRFAFTESEGNVLIMLKRGVVSALPGGQLRNG